MDWRDQLEALIEEHDGLVLSKDVDGKGIPRQYLTMLVKEGKLQRVSRGVYVIREVYDDVLYRLQALNTKIIYSHDTALYFHTLTEIEPGFISVTVPYGYNATHLRKEGVKVYTVKRDLFSLGAMEMKTSYGRPIIIYDRERTVCDIMRIRNKRGKALLQSVIKNYFAREDIHSAVLEQYSTQMKVDKALKPYIDLYT